jgi:L-threonylcarbamoyladenylate synthase
MMDDPIGDSVARVRSGGLVAYPTETVWGIGADATSDAAVAGLFAWKGRAADSVSSVLIADPAELEGLGFDVGEATQKLVAAFWPGPLTLVIPCRGTFARGIANSNGAVGVRCAAHPLAAALARRCAAEGVGPITATSLNRSGVAPARSRSEAAAAVAGDPDAPEIIRVETAEAGGDLETTVVDVSGERPKILRLGSIAAAELDPVIEEIGFR